jgi:GntR family transcriptional repressor for pyruvate dehydrogenase complex
MGYSGDAGLAVPGFWNFGICCALVRQFLPEASIMKHIKRKKLYEEVTAGIIDIIKTNKMKTGDKLLSGNDLCEQFGVSRMVIREALCALQSSGIIEVRHGSGNYLKNIDDLYKEDLDIHISKQHILHTLEFRKGFECQAAYLAAERSSKEEQTEMADVLDRMRQAISSGGNAAEEDYLFHSLLTNATHNTVFIRVFNDVISANFFESLKSSHRYFSKVFGPRMLIVDEHMGILNCIINGRAKEASVAMHEHLENVEKKVHRLLHAKN